MCVSGALLSALHHSNIIPHSCYEIMQGWTLMKGPVGTRECHPTSTCNALHAPPFVHPLTGLNHNELGAVYSEVQSWCMQLKIINEDIQIMQEWYQAITDGVFVKGWLLSRHELWFLPEIQLIEGHLKEDV
jgi:calcium permeable stress-gated cation channel